MTASDQRLNPIPSRKRNDVTIADFIRAFERHHTTIGNSPRTIGHDCCTNADRFKTWRPMQVAKRCFWDELRDRNPP